MNTATITVGIHYETYDPIDTQIKVWRAVDEAGFDHIWNSDHLSRTQSSGHPEGPLLEAWSMLGAQAVETDRVRIGVLVTGNIHRHPAWLAKLGTTVDHLSHGRLEMGIGTGWNADALNRVGIAVPDAPTRARMLDEACRVMKALWTQERATYKGRFYEIADAIHEPKPVQKPHPPIVIGGRGPKVTTRAAARHAATWNTSGGRGFDADKEAMQALDAHCLKIGRDPKTLRRSVNLGWDGGKGLELAKRYREIGFTDFIIAIGEEKTDALRDVDTLHRDALPKLRALG